MSSYDGDPQLMALAARSAECAEQANEDGEEIRALRRELDGLWVSHRTRNGKVVWVWWQRATRIGRSA